MSIILSHDVQGTQCLLVVIEKHIFYIYEKIFDINAVVIEIKAIYWKMLKWAFYPILGAKRHTHLGQNARKWGKIVIMGQNAQYGIEPIISP